QSAGWSKGGAYAHEDVRIITTAGPIPPDAIVVANTVDGHRRDRIASALVRVAVQGATRDMVTSLFSGEGFLLATASQYEPLRRLCEHNLRRARARGAC